MRKKNIAAVLTVVMLSLGLTGCGDNMIPEMTDDQLQLIGEYAAVTLMKYDASNRSRLVELPEETDPVIPDPMPPEMSEEPSGMGAVDDTPIVSTPDNEPVNDYSMEEVLGLGEGISVAYVDGELSGEYPYDSETDYFKVTASEGRQLLVLHFSIANGTGQDQTVDLFSQETSFRITVNEDYTRRAMTTWLLDDMATFKGTIPAGETREVVLVIEVEQNSMSEIASVTLNLKNDSKTYTIQLL